MNGTSEQGEQVNHPAHYQHESGVEAITLCEWENFNRGSALKYLLRAGKKPGADEITDLEKCLFSVKREIERLKTLKKEPPW